MPDYSKQYSGKPSGREPRHGDRPGKGAPVYEKRSPQAELLERMKRVHAEKAQKKED